MIRAMGSGPAVVNGELTRQDYYIILLVEAAQGSCSEERQSRSAAGGQPRLPPFGLGSMERLLCWHEKA
jgi:hypothetical protein